MIYSTDLTEISGKINHLNIIKYVSDLHWVKYTGKVKEGLSIYQKTVNERFYQINIPCDKSFYDYAIAMRKVVSILALTEKKSEEQIILELLNPLSDILRFRDISDSVENGSILLEDGIRLFENAKRLVLSAAQDVVNYKRTYKGRISDQVQKFVDQCRYGQTEIGSYVVSIVCPFANLSSDGEYKQLSIFSEETEAANSMTRQTTKKIFDSISEIKNTLDAGGDLCSLIEDESKKISVSFVESLMNLNLSKPNDSIEISAKWAPTIYENKPQVDMISISHDYYDPMKCLVDKYKKEEELNDVVFEGKISELEANTKIEDRKQGQATLVYISGTSLKTIKLSMDKENYDIAIIAHKEGKTIRAVGEKAKRHLKNVTIEIL